MVISTTTPHISDADLDAFVREVTAALLLGKRHQTPGFGTFTTCTRKATSDRSACKMAMFRPSAELRDYATGGARPESSGPHAGAINMLIEAMQSDVGINVPRLGLLAVVPVAGKKPKLIFHGDSELNDALAAS